MTSAPTGPQSQGNRIWVVLAVLVVITSVLRYASVVALVEVGGYASPSSPGCSNPANVPGYDEVSRAGYRFLCVDDIPSTETGDVGAGYEVVGVTDPITKTISILNTDGDESLTQAHETAHALADIYEDVTAEGYYMSKTGIDHWYPAGADDYFDSGSESFAETYAMCALGKHVIGLPMGGVTFVVPGFDVVDYKLGSCDVVNRTLDMMRHPR